MPVRRLVLVASLGLMGLLGCSRRPPAAYATARAEAEREYSAGRYAAAAESWLDAAAGARSERDAQEARYRAATSYERAGDTDAAIRTYAALSADPGAERSARAAFARAELILAEDPEAGNAALDAAIQTYPTSGVARLALERRLAAIDAEQGARAALAFLDRLRPALDDTELAEAVAYERARHLEATGDDPGARDAYLAVARRFPYPGGDYWDDALYRAAQLDRKLGRPQTAIEHLQAMLAAREPRPSLTGSYERPRFGQARFLIAEIYRDDLADLPAARRTFLVLVKDHPTSLLRDDALFEAALVARRLGDEEAACSDLERLLRELPGSRFTACAAEVCPRLPPAESACRSYIKDRIEATPR